MPAAPTPPLARALAQADRLRALTPQELTVEIARLSALPPGPAEQMQLALALLQTRQPADGQRAAAVLQGLLQQQGDEARALHPLARLLAAQQAEHRRLEEAAERQAQQARDAQRRIDQLNERLEALRAIERSRPPGAREAR